MYEMDARVRFSETDESGRLSMSGLLRLFQDCGYFHALARGQANTPNSKNPTTWFLLKWHIEAYEMPLCGDKIKIGTWIYSSGESIAHKQLVLLDKFGKTLALGDTMWVCVDADTGKPALPRDGVWLEEDYGERLALKHRLGRIAECNPNSPKTTAMPKGIVDEKMLDINRHANNVMLTEYAMSAAGCCSSCTFLVAEFLKQAKPGQTLYPYIEEDENGKTVSVCNADRVSFARFRFE